ncbi:hypothetical protein [Synechococcus sp. H70.2]|uniref:hypothetical protein n=1 Tax=unclassified Synechococcus TaxID=2626047 RepID=UPI0039C3BF69
MARFSAALACSRAAKALAAQLQETGGFRRGSPLGEEAGFRQVPLRFGQVVVDSLQLPRALPTRLHRYRGGGSDGLAPGIRAPGE